MMDEKATLLPMGMLKNQSNTLSVTIFGEWKCIS